MATSTPSAIPAAKASNSKAMLQAAIDKSKEFGALSGAGAASKVGWYMDIGERSKNGEIMKDDAEVLYDAFFEAQQQRAGMARAAKGKDRGVRISEAKRIIACCALPNINGLKVLDTTLRVVRDNAWIKGEVDDKLLFIARKQCQQPDKPLSADEIKHHLKPKEREDKDEADMLAPAAALVNKVAKKYNWDPHKRSAFASLNARIEQLGGTSKMKREAAKKANKGKAKKKA